MSAEEALRSPVALFYGALAVGLLLLARLLFAVLRVRSGPAWQAYRGWLVIIPITAAAILLGRETAIVFFTGVSVLAFREFARATALVEDGWLSAAGYVGILALGAAALIPDYDLFITLPVFVTAGLLAIPVLRNRVQGQLHALGLALLGFLAFGWMFGHVDWLANSEHAYAYLLYLLFAVELNDIAAYVSGKLLGKHALCSNISPKKTWEGSLGALAVSLALPWMLWFTFPHLRWYDLVAVGLIVGVGGQVGDLVVSLIKRDVGIKDLGSIIPGHGGILDRIDSLIYVAPLYVQYLRFSRDLDPP